MGGTKIGGQRAAQTNKERYGKDFYQKLGKKGGLISKGGHFKDPEQARYWGSIGGRISTKPNKIRYDCNHSQEEEFEVNGVRYKKCVECRKVRKK